MKIVLTVMFMVNVFLADAFLSFAVLYAFLLIVSTWTGKSLKHGVRGIKPILYIALFTMLVNIFAVKGTPLLDVGVLRHISREGVVLAVKIILRLFLLLTGASLLTATTTPISLMDGLESLLKPLKRIRLPVHETAMMMSIALRFVPVLLEEGEKIVKAQASRCADFATGNPLRKAGSCVPILIPLFVGAFRRADDLAVAMEARCYRGGEGRSRMKRLRFTGVDVICMAVMLLLSSVIVGVEYF